MLPIKMDNAISNFQTVSRFNMNLVKFLLSLMTIKDLSVVIDIFKFKNIHYGIMFHCHKDEAAISMQKIFYSNNIRMTTLKTDCSMAPKIHHSYPQIGLVVNTSCEGWTSVLNVLNSKIAFKSPFVWIIITEDLSTTASILSEHPIEVNSDVTVIYKTHNNYYLYEIYNTGFYKRGLVKIIDIGFWNNSLQVMKPSRFDLGGIVMKCTLVIVEKIGHQSFESYLTHLGKIKVDSMHKRKFFAVLTYFKDMYNISYILQRTNSWGYLRNGSFDGLVGALQSQNADIGGTPVFFRSDRAKYVDYTAQTWQCRPCFILRHPKHPGGFYTIYTRPLTPKVWCCILILIAISAGVLSVMLKIQMLKEARDDKDSSTSLAILFIWSAICQQGMSIRRNSTAVKVVIFVSFVFAITLYQYYNATVVSTLLQETPKNIRTIQDLIKSDLKAGVEDVLYNKDFFKRTTDPWALKIYHKKIVTPDHYNFFTPEEGLALVKKGGFAFHVESSIAYRIIRNTFTEREVCETHEVTLYPPQYMGAVVKKGSPYKEHVSYGIRKMSEAGLMHRLKSMWDDPRPPCVRTPDSSVFSVTIREFSTALIALAFGMVASIAILLCEIIFHRIDEKRNFIEFRH